MNLQPVKTTGRIHTQRSGRPNMAVIPHELYQDQQSAANIETDEYEAGLN